MKLSEWIDKHPRDKRQLVRQRLAKTLKVSESLVRHYANGNRRVPAERVPDLSEATGGEVTPQEVRPDVFRR